MHQSLTCINSAAVPIVGAESKRHSQYCKSIIGCLRSQILHQETCTSICGSKKTCWDCTELWVLSWRQLECCSCATSAASVRDCPARAQRSVSRFICFSCNSFCCFADVFWKCCCILHQSGNANQHTFYTICNISAWCTFLARSFLRVHPVLHCQARNSALNRITKPPSCSYMCDCKAHAALDFEPVDFCETWCKDAHCRVQDDAYHQIRTIF